MLPKINRVLEIACMVVSGLSIVFMAAVAFVDSIGRPLNHPLPGGNEMVTFALLLFFFSSMPLMVKADSHIRVGLFSDFYGASMRRIERVVTAVLETLALAVLAWMIFDQASRLARFGTQSVYFELPMGPWVFVACAFTVIAVWFAVLAALAPQSAEKAE